MADIEKVKQGVKACWSEHWYHRCFDCPYKPDRDNDNACVERLGADVLELLKNLKNLIDGLIEDQLKKDEEQQAEIERLKYELNQYHKADTFLAVHGWQWKDDGTEHYTEQLKDGEQE